MSNDYHPIMVKNKLLCIIHKIENKEVKNNELVNLVEKFTSHVVPTCFGDYWPQDDINLMVHELFMADILLCVNIRSQAINSLMKIVKMIEHRTLGELMFKKRLLNICMNHEDYTGPFSQLCLGLRHFIILKL